MLVLSRHKGESIILVVPPSTEEQRIQVMLTDILPKKVKLGVICADEVKINREEIQDKIDGENECQG